MLNEEGKPALLGVLKDDGIDMTDRGSYCIGCCPFHDDKTPSFVVYKNGGRYTCFGCGEKGDVIDYICKSKGMFFSQAVKYLKIKYASEKYIKKRPDILHVIIEEEREGVDVEKKYGKTFIDTLLAKELVRRSNET